MATVSAASPSVAGFPERCKVSLGLFHGSFLILGGVMALSSFVELPVLLQMLLYTLPILYVGSHLSLKQNEIDAVTGERVNKGEAMNRTDALLFPVFGSVALFSLYLAYKFLGTLWVNLLLTLYLAGVGLVAFAETLFAVLKPLCPSGFSDDSQYIICLKGYLRVLRHFGATYVPRQQQEAAAFSGDTGEAAASAASSSAADSGRQPFAAEEVQLSSAAAQEAPAAAVAATAAAATTEAAATTAAAAAAAAGGEESSDGEWVFRLSPLLLLCYFCGSAVCCLWLITKHWILHNVLAVAFCVQAIAIVSVGSFTIAAILLSGLFVYDIFWVFGTEVMVTVAKSFEGPAKLIFPVRLSPLQYSILGLGDVVIPGVLISMCLRFDAFINQQHDEKHQTSVDIHQRFPKFYFWVVLAFYELGLLTTGIVMLAIQHPQPALLYLVPYCLLSLFGAAALNGRVKEVLAYKEDDEASVAAERAIAEKKDS